MASWTSDDVPSSGSATGLVADAINDGVTTVAPSQNAVFDALTGKETAGAAATAQAFAVQRTNHTGTQTADTLTDGTTNKAYTATERTKLGGIATAATANDTDANLKNRTNHTGTQPASTISDLAEAVRDTIGTALAGAAGISVTVDDAGDTITIVLSQAVNAQTGTSYTLVAGDAGKLVTLSNAGAVTLTVPQDSDATIAVGTYVDLMALGAGQVTVAAGSGATLRTSGLTAKSRAQYARLGVQKIAANTWSLFGDLAAS
jgi:hypothetical protein